jgi:carbamoyl-phosphate synthase large subunit
VSRLLFTGGGGASSEALYRLLGGRHDVHFADADPDARPPSVPPDAWHTIPSASAAAFIDELTALCRSLDVDLLVPGVDEELLAISRARSVVAREVLLPPTEFVRAHLDKLASNALLASRAIPVPVTELLGDRRRVSFPCVVKPRSGRGSRDVAVVRSEDELLAHPVACRRPAEDFIVQEQLRGQEYTVTMVADAFGILRAIVPVRVELKRGITLRAETDRDEAVISACAAIHRAQPIAGCFNIQAIKTGAGEVKPFEINPRISTTTCLAIAAGVDVVDLYLGGEVSTLEAGELAPFQNCLRLKRSWHNEFIGAGHGVTG